MTTYLSFPEQWKKTRQFNWRCAGFQQCPEHNISIPE